MAKNQNTAVAPAAAAAPIAAATKVRVLVNGSFGAPDDVVELGGQDLEQALASGQVDQDPDAVAYAESLQ